MNNQSYRWRPGFLFKEVDNSALIVFRIIFGGLLFYHVISSITEGTVYENFIRPPFTFNFIGFDFLQPLPGNGMYFYFALMAILALMIMLGAWYRLSIIAFTIMWLCIYLMQKAGYNNHYYLVLLICSLMVFVPAANYCSIDVKRKAARKMLSCPRWVILIFIAQVAIVYFFAGTSKLYADWFSGKFIAIQFSRLSTHHVVGIIYSQKWFQLFICYGGFFFDLLIVPLLLWKNTRNYAFIVSCLFHLFNSYTFRIGIFPYLSIALNLFFLNPGKIRSFFFKNKPRFVSSHHHDLIIAPANSKWITYALAVYLLIQVILPLRPLFYPGNVFWTEEGYRMSWKMMLRTKSGNIHFKVVDPISKKIWNILPSKIFTPSQVMWLAISPDIIWQYAQRIKNDFAKKEVTNVQVYAIGWVSLNRSVPRPLVNPTTDLTNVKWHPFKHSDWIMAFEEAGVNNK
jgi:hypothetical protein